MSGKSLHDDRARGNSRAGGAGNSKATCVDIGRVFDSCSDRDCMEDVRVYFSDCDQQTIDAASYIRAKKAKVLATQVEMEALPFQEGCYSCKLTFFVEIQIEVCGGCEADPDVLRGCAILEKKVVLYGGEGSVHVFSGEWSDGCCAACEMKNTNVPRCNVQVAEPVVLDVRRVDACGCYAACGCGIPETVSRRFAGGFAETTHGKIVQATIGLFTIVQMIRNVQVLVPVYDYCLPCSDCSCNEETPCDLFRRMSFPIEEFFPSANKGHNGK